MATIRSGSLDPHGGPLLINAIVANSITIQEYDSVKASSGFVALGTAGALVLGHVDAIVTSKDIGLLTPGTAGADPGTFVGAYTTASDNQTVAMVKAKVDVSKTSVYSMTPDAAIGTTTGSNLLGYHTDIADEDNTDEDTAATGTAQYTILGVDPKNSANQRVTIYESQIFGV